MGADEKPGEGKMAMLSTVGSVGMHLVSGPMVGFGVGYALDAWLDTKPVCLLIFLLIGIAAGFLNVYQDMQSIRHISESDK